MYTGYAMKCRFPDVGLIRNALEDIASVTVIDPADLPKVNPPADIIFFGWGRVHEEGWRDSEEERRVKAITAGCIQLRKLRNMLAFRDTPILVVIEEQLEHDILMMATQFGAAGFLSAPLVEEDIRTTVRDALRPVGREMPIDVRIVNPFVEAVLLTLERLAQIQVEKKDVFLKRNYSPLGDISAVMGITGTGIEGAVGLTFQEELAREVVGKMWKVPPGELTRERLNDGLGEMVKVICGQATARMMKQNDYNLTLALPTIVTGFGHVITHESTAPCLVITFQSGKLYFAVQVAIRMLGESTDQNAMAGKKD